VLIESLHSHILENDGNGMAADPLLDGLRL
jgi:hypothetical protein